MKERSPQHPHRQAEGSSIRPGDFCPLIFCHFRPSSDFGTSAGLSLASALGAEKDQCRRRWVFVAGGATSSDLTHCGLCLEAAACRPLWGAGK